MSTLDSDVTMIPAGESSSSTVPSASSKKPKPFELKRWNAVAFWSWDNVNTCAICKKHIIDLCGHCEAKQVNATSEECTVAWGVCNHAFHLHCISSWIDHHQQCPLDQSKWEFQKSGY